MPKITVIQSFGNKCTNLKFGEKKRKNFAAQKGESGLEHGENLFEAE